MMLSSKLIVKYDHDGPAWVNPEATRDELATTVIQLCDMLKTVKKECDDLRNPVEPGMLPCGCPENEFGCHGYHGC